MTHKTYQPAERAGIWIDHKTAYFIKISADHSPTVEELETGIKSRNINPEEEKTHTRLAQSSSNGHDHQQQHQQYELQAFFRVLMHRIRTLDYIYLFGPGEAKQELNRSIAKEGVNFPCKVVGIETTDKLTKNQMERKVIEYFTSLKYEDTIRKFGLESVNNIH